jgi:hypothetical protein
MRSDISNSQGASAFGSVIGTIVFLVRRALGLPA